MPTREREKIFESLRRRFLPDRSAGWVTRICFEFTDSAPATFEVSNRELTIHEGLEVDPLSTVSTDLETFETLFAGRMPLELAMMRNRFRTDNLVEIFKLQTVFEKES